MQSPAVGRIVLFATEDGERPMLITKVWDDTIVNGHVFFDGPNDREQKRLGGINLMNGHGWATKVGRGRAPGMWRFHDDP